MTNLEYATKILELRNALIESGQEDPFVPQGKRAIVTEDDRAGAQRVADVLQQCIDYAEGDSLIFTNELMRRTKDVHIATKKRK